MPKKIYNTAFANTQIVENNEKNEKIEEEFNDNINDILGDIESDELDSFIENDFDLDFLNSFSFIELVKNILNGNYFSDYSSLFSAVISYIKENIKSLVSIFLTIFALIILNEMFSNFCINKYQDIKKIVNLVFSLIFAVILVVMFKEIYELIFSIINKILDFSKILFPILLSLILMSGSNGTFTSYSSLSTFLIETGAHIFVYILLPIVSSIVMLTIINIIFNDNKFSKLISLLKSFFKYIIIAFFSVFGLFSMINIVSSGLSDGVNYKLTKFAIKTYIPVLGGYISDGFDFVHTCSVLVKNSFGICGIIVLFFIILKPSLLCIVYIFMFKILSVFISFIGKQKYANYFESLSSVLTYFLAILAGIFMCIFVFIYLLILSVSVI